jgi:hypothetical protein
MSDGHTHRGKWARKDVPHKGWICVGIEDLGEPSEICGMCESVEIRYVHSMQHSDHPQILGVGCICAEHMEQDYVGPRLREKKLRSQAHRRRTWSKRKWSISGRGNSFLNAEGFNLTIFKVEETNNRQWVVKVTHRDSGLTQLGRRRYPSEDAAKSAALDALLWARQHLIPDWS